MNQVDVSIDNTMPTRATRLFRVWLLYQLNKVHVHPNPDTSILPDALSILYAIEIQNGHNNYKVVVGTTDRLKSTK